MMEAELALLREFARRHPGEAARAFEPLALPETAAIVADLDPGDGAAVFRKLSPARAADILAAIEPPAAVAILCRLPADLAAALLRRAGMRPAEAILDAMPQPWRGRLASVLVYPPEAAGSWMDPLAEALPGSLRAAAALEQIGERPQYLSFAIFVIDEEQRLAGRLDLRRLMLADPGEPLAELMSAHPLAIHEDEALAALAGHPAWEEFDTLPVVDANGIFLGALPHAALRRWQRRRERAGEEASPARVALALADLFWVGMAGVIDLTAEAALHSLTSKQELGGQARGA